MLDIRFTGEEINTSNFDDILRGWHTLVEPLSKSNSVSWCYALYRHERKHNNRPFILDRILSRMIALGTHVIRRWVYELCEIKIGKKEGQ